MNRFIPAALAALMPFAAVAEEAESSFVEANILGIFYHELAHALIDLEQVPIFGQEEDAADVFSILMIHTLFEEEAAQALAYDAAWGFIGEAEMREGGVEEIAWWDTHGPDEQRFYNTVCLFYGANPDAREEFAKEFDLPQERAEYCPMEYEQADASWGVLLDELTARGAGQTITFEGDTDSLTAQVIAEEVKALNNELSLSTQLTVREESCGEANAFYDPEAREVVFCSEFEDHLRQMEAQL
ncbi:DUF4344 domain-containing metallopeptidase [Thalassobius sp. Cn5-15]|jgi:hypothetical protein|uniref:DUF4344 domain-containing metallopeptidase n=1 Tax=Thalassobius sp. Cn5-15 TaxID=2917763 RepID=UPI001EF1A202|nr:DUF4344 domain-containing metallopeptidase [Thalassobius sp. Cn5-15]MCG7493324.1 DUF4344 domain-containing metallopeptidase [Thalassobius sp. Cn5-15]